MLYQSKLSKTAYKMADPAEWLIGNWQSLDPVFAGRLAYYAKCTGKKMRLNECIRSTELQAIYYAEYQKYKNTGILGPHGIKLAAAPGTSWHEIALAADVDDTHALYHASNASLAAYGLCKPLVSKGEFWHVQPIETAKKGSKCIKSMGPTDLAPYLKQRFGIGDQWIKNIEGYEYGVDFAAALLAGKKTFEKQTITYFSKFAYWPEFKAKTGIAA